jgi:glycosyltransferase involved in cell wall biosynthesis
MSSKRPHPASSLKPPAIPVLPVDDGRPFWSVMIPTYNPRADYLEDTLHSVLQQDPGPEQMQIEVIDDRSTDDLAAQTVRRVGGGRVSFHAEPQNRGLAGTWNRCIERARGHWVHILHQDDIVLPGFYDHLRKGAEHSDAGAIFCRYAVVNLKGHWMGISELHRESAGLLDDWHARITVQQLVQCPAIAVRRLIYEQLGGFLPQLRYTPDWEMWQRIASQFSFWFEPSILACYRVHPNSATSRMRLDAADVREVRELINLTTAYHSPARGRVLARKARSFYAGLAVLHARDMLVGAEFRPAWKQVVEALRLCRSRRIIWQISSFFVLWFRIIASRLKRRMKFKSNASSHP